MEQHTKEENIKYYSYNEFINTDFSVNKIHKANWKQDGKLVALKSFSLNNVIIKEIVNEIKIQREADFNNVMIKLYGITKTDTDEHLLVVEYAGSTLRNYLEKNFLSLNWKDKCELAIQLSGAVKFLHERGIVHKDLHSISILVQKNSIRLADSGLSKRIMDASETWLDTIPYTDPQGFQRFDIEEITSDAVQKFELNEKSDVYSVGVLLWELSSGKKPFSGKEYGLFLAKEIIQGLREAIVKGTPEKYHTLYERCWNGNANKRPKIQEVVTTLKSMVSSLDLEYSESANSLLYKQQQLLVQQLKSNHGLFLNGYNIGPSKQAVFTKDGELNISLYKGQPLVYTSVNDRNSRVNLLSFNSDNDVELHESLGPSDICINFPVAVITFAADLSESFLNFTGEDGVSLHDIYGHLFPRKILIGGKLFINNLKIATATQIDMFKSFLTWIHDLAKYKKEIPFKNLPALNFFPKIVTTKGVNLNTQEELIDWMNKLYQYDAHEIISYNSLVPVSQLKFDKILLVDEIQPGIANYKKKLSLDNWVGDSLYANITKWVKEFHLLHGLIIDQNFEFGISKEVAIDLINFPNIDSNNNFHLEIVKPTTILEEILINNNIFSTKNDNKNICSFPFIKVSDDQSNKNYVYFLLKYERYNILLNRDIIRPSNKFKQAIEKALKSMKPHMCLQKVFDEYGHFFPLNFILGKSFKNTIENSLIPSKKIVLVSPIFDSIRSHLADFNISCLLTQNGDIVEGDLSEWIQNINDSINDLEIVESNKIISLYEILEENQKKRIDIVLNKQDNFKIIMAGCVSLKDLDISKQITINIEPSLENKNYEVFGTIISKDNLKVDNLFVTFGSYETNNFSAMINISENANINTEEYYMLWMIIGNPSKLSVFCPKNRELQVDYIKESIKLQRDDSFYSIRTSRQLSQGFEIFINCFKPINIKLTGWSKNCIHLNISKSNYTQSEIDNVEIAICVLSSDHENPKIDVNGKREYIFTEYNYLDIQKYINSNYPTKEEREKLTKFIISRKNLEGHLDLSEFVNLEKIDCSENQITSLDISKNKLLTEIDCSKNKLTNLDLSNCLKIISIKANCNQLKSIKLSVVNNERLKYLNLLDNSFSQDLNCFSHFVNLKELLIGNIDEDKIKQGIYNQFYDSLEPLKNISELESLNISNTDIDGGLEYLSDSIKCLQCLANKRPEAKVNKIFEQLEIYAMSITDAAQGKYNLRAWKVNWKLTKEKEALQNQINQIELTLDTQFIELIKKENSLDVEKENLIVDNNQIEEKIKVLKQLAKVLSDKLKQKEDYYLQIKLQLCNKEELLSSLTIEQITKKEDLRKEIIVLEGQLVDKKKAIEQLGEELERVNEKLKIKENESEDLKNKLNEIELSKSVIKNKKEELNNLKEELKHKRCFTKDNTYELRNKINGLKIDLKNDEELLQTQTLNSDRIKNELEKIRKDKQILLDEQEVKNAYIGKLQSDKDNIQYKLNIRTNEYSDKEDIINELKQQNKQLIEELQRKLNEEIKKSNKSQKKLEKLKKAIEEDTSDTN
ncbi:hypothetical protein RclHR1_00830002 [Rhizophagus clarus]|uniref:Kinase-like domain-containing protein n=1 Tax=Rhizophagus clarus TaxID=94130 RepID=A0A2Z6S2A0_9GLOM|nr:hypothetical protein RclHR1_00830002 [Rhizophagus clarus]GES99706.1 kinase-like domain-containing protein [Rhizophagus clarus]